MATFDSIFILVTTLSFRSTTKRTILGIVATGHIKATPRQNAPGPSSFPPTRPFLGPFRRSCSVSSPQASSRGKPSLSISFLPCRGKRERKKEGARASHFRSDATTTCWMLTSGSAGQAEGASDGRWGKAWHSDMVPLTYKQQPAGCVCVCACLSLTYMTTGFSCHGYFPQSATFKEVRSRG